MSSDSTLGPKKIFTPWYERLFLTLCLSLTFLWIYSGQAFLANNVDNDADSSFFVYGGQVLLSGGTLYEDFWDQKPPMIFWQNAMLLKLFGRDFHAWAWAHGLLIAGLSLLWLREMRLRVGTTLASIGLLLLAFIFNSNKLLDFGNRTEFGVAIMEMLALLMMLRAWRKECPRSLIVAGAASAIAFFYKPIGMASFLATLAFCVFWKQRELSFPILKPVATGFAGTFLVLSIPLLITGQWLNMFNAAIFLPLQFSGAGTPGVTEAFTNTLQRLGPFWGIAASLLALPFAISFSRGNERSLLLWLLLFFLATLCGIILQRHGRPHYDHPLAVPLVSLGLLSLHTLRERFSTTFSRLSLPILWLALTLVFGQYFIRQQIVLSLHQPEIKKRESAALHNTAKYLSGDLKADETFYYWSLGYAPYLLTERSSPGHLSPAFAAFGGAGVDLMREDLERVKASPNLTMILENPKGHSHELLNPEDPSLPPETQKLVLEYLNWRDQNFTPLNLPELEPFLIYRRVEKR